MWVRGLKHRKLRSAVWRLCVAPHVGAWIETIGRGGLSLYEQVAPHVGAWIETTTHNKIRCS